MKTKLLTIAMTAALMLTAMTKVQAQNFDGPCLPPSHGLDDHQSAFCGVMQVIELSAGSTYVSFNVETDLDAVKAALLAALPGTTSILIQGKNQNTKYNGRRWNGQLTALDLAQMYIIQVEDDCEISLEGMRVDPTEHPATIANGANYIAYPFNTSMTVTNAFAGFAVNDDIVQSKNKNAKYNGRRWNGQLTELTPGQGYIYNSASTETRTFVFPTGSSKVAPVPNK